MIGAMHAAKKKRFFTPVSSAWVLTFCEEFVGTTLPARWSISTNTSGSNVQLASANISVANSKAKLVSTHPGGTPAYAGALIFTGSFGYTFPVYIECRALMPSSGGSHAADGIYPAFWGNGFYGGGANSDPPEIDFFEFHGEPPPGGTVPNMYVGGYDQISDGVFYSPTPGQYMSLLQTGRTNSGVSTSSPDLTLSYHVWGFYWTSTSMTWYIDGISQGTMTNGGSCVNNNTGSAATFTAPASSYGINVQLECQPGINAANVTGNTVFPSSAYFDYVHVYQQSGTGDTVQAGYGGPGDVTGGGGTASSP